MASSPSSEFEWTDEALAVIDAAARPAPSHVAVESPTASTSAVKVEDAPRQSLFDRFRSANTLSVSDLVGPGAHGRRAKPGALTERPDWCEVQHTYGLLNKRNRAPENRSPTFVTDSGKVVNVNQDKILERERILVNGTAVHTKLEREIMPETITVEVTTDVDRAGLKYARR
jgi:exonuclease V